MFFQMARNNASNNLYFRLLRFFFGEKIIFLSVVSFLSWLNKYVKPHFSQYQSYKNN